MIHLGDITKISGYTAPPVEVVIGGSPCQDLSVAGKRAGLQGERSGLFMEQIRIIKEMRENDRRIRTDDHVRPRYMVWENVPGAFSSAKGEDFRAVLEETARIVEEDAIIPRPADGKWTTAGCILGDGWSIAWRVLDAQFWGVPQRRRRIALVADFGGHTAPEILFEREGVSGDPSESATAREGTSADAERSVGTALQCGNPWDSQSERVYVGDGAWHSLNSNSNGGQNRDAIVVYNEETITSKTNASNPAVGDPCHTLGATGAGRTICIQGNCIDRADTAGCNGKGWRDDDVNFTLNTIDRPAVFVLDQQGGKGGANYAVNVCPSILSDSHGTPHAVYDARGNGDGKTAPTLTGDHQNRVTDYTAVCVGNGQLDQLKISDKVGALNCMHDQQAVMVSAVDCWNTKETMREKPNGTITRSKVLRVLQKAYGTKALVEWETAIMAALQQPEILQSKLHDCVDEIESENRNELDDCTLPCAEFVAGWLLRDMRERKECRCPSQGWEPEKQRFEQSPEIMQKLPCSRTSYAEALFDMWRQGEGIRILRQALSEIQEIRKSIGKEEKRGFNIVRRLTPLEAERLQGYPDGWTDLGEWTDSRGKVHQTSDSARYKALGNSIALPPWRFVLSRLNAYLTEHTMASLFDGIGGFSLIWQELNGPGKCLWASEIEEFPIAVTKRRIG